MEVPRHWRNQNARYSLKGSVCNRCDLKLMPPQDVCPQCHGDELAEFQFSGRGRLYSYAVMVQGPQGFASLLPYPVALVKLDEGPTIAAQLCDLGDIAPSMDMPVEMVTRRLHEDGKDGLIVYGYKFRPSIEQSR